MTENRVRVATYGRIANAADPRLVPIPSAPGYSCTLHYLAAAAFTAMCAACYIGTGIRLVAASGWRAHRWKSRAEYEAYLIAHYGGVDKGRKWVAFDSPHETGLAVDFGSGGLTPDRDTAQTQKLTLAYRWLRDKAHIYGWTPYLPEPWHWEFNISKEAWARVKS